MALDLASLRNSRRPISWFDRPSPRQASTSVARPGQPGDQRPGLRPVVAPAAPGMGRGDPRPYTTGSKPNRCSTGSSATRTSGSRTEARLLVLPLSRGVDMRGPTAGRCRPRPPRRRNGTRRRAGGRRSTTRPPPPSTTQRINLTIPAIPPNAGVPRSLMRWHYLAPDGTPWV